MIAMTTKNGKCVRLTADCNIDTETVNYEVYCAGTTFVFTDFALAARVYKTLSERIESKTLTDACIKNLALGDVVMEVA